MSNFSSKISKQVDKVNKFSIISHNINMLTIFYRTIIIFTTVLLVVRLMGKRQIGEMQPFELVITLVIADLACIPMSDVSIPLLYGVASIVSVYFMHSLVALICKKSLFFRKFFSGKPIIIIDTNGICVKELNNLGMTVNDLLEAIRSAGFFSVDEISYAIFETNGKLSVLPNDSVSSPSSVPINFIIEGKVKKDELIEQQITIDQLLNASHIEAKSIKNILILCVDDSGKIFMQEKTGKYRTYNSNLSVKV